MPDGDSLSILIVEDNPGDLLLTQKLLKNSRLPIRQIVSADSLGEALSLIHSADAILLDLSLPDSDGIDTFITLNEHAPLLPIIVLSGTTNAELALETVRLGAQDYLVKGEFDEKLLEKSVYYSIERKKNLDILRESEERYKYLFENSPIPMWAYDVETLQFIMVNEAAVKHYGYSKEEFLSMKLMDIRPQEDVIALTEQGKSTSEELDSAEVWRHLKKDGSIIFVEIILHRQLQFFGRNADLVLANDVTEKLRVQKDILLQANILQNIKDIVIAVNLRSEIIYWNQLATETYGYAAKDMIGLTWQDAPSQLSIKFDQVLTYLASHSEFTTEQQILTKSGDRVWLDLKINFIYDAHGQAYGLLIIAKDITTRKGTEAKLLIQQSAIEAVGIGITISDPYASDNPVIYANPKFFELSGYSESEVIGKNCRYLQGVHTDAETLKCIRIALRNQQSFAGEILNYRKTGESFWNMLVIDPIFDEKGTLLNYVGFQQDITDKKRAEEELIYKNTELNTFIYRASHDLRSPIASLIGLAQVAKLEFDDPKVINYFNLMQQSSVRLDDVLKNLLNLTAIRQGEPQLEEVVFEQLATTVIESISNTSDFKNSQVELDFQPSTRLITDQTILSSILLNLLENALRYRKTTGNDHWVKVSFSQLGNRNQLRVSDNGIGISRESISKVFDMFYRGTEMSKGSGLGLYIVKTFAEKLNGKVEITSEPRLGTSVTVNFLG